MKKVKTALAALAVLFAWNGVGHAQGVVDFGSREYAASCASCHGPVGKGDGSLVRYLVSKPTDLTTLTRRNGGVFPSQRVWETIDGRGSVDIGPHGSREMPVWGLIYRSEDTQPHDLHARNRIASLLDYLARIQQKQ
jgi:mono/diheme cytochrome c family protein